MELHTNSVDVPNGAALTAATITVTDSTGAVAAIFDTTGAAKANPFTSDARTGMYSFKAANGTYTVSIAKTGIEATSYKVTLFDPADNDGTNGNLSDALQLADYAALRAYAGNRKAVYITGYLASAAPSGIAGMFVRDDADTTSADNGGTVIVAANGKRWKRVHNGAVDVRWFGAAGGGVVNDAPAIQSALNSGALVIDGCGLTMKINSSVTVPAGVTFRNFTLNAGAVGMNMVLVNSRAAVCGKLVGTGTTSTIERAIYPAADGVSDVTLDCEISNITVGIHAQPLAALTPKRWRISGYIHDIVGTPGTSEGYGVLLSPAESCEVNVRCANIARHAVYLSAGAAYNNVHADVDGCNNLAVQLYSTAAQPETKHNTIRGKFRNLTQNAVNQGGAVGIIQKANYNDVSVVTDGSGNTSNAIWVEGQSGGPYPTGNNVHDCEITGSYLANVINVINADRTVVRDNTITAGWATAAIFLLKSGAADVSHGGVVEGNSIYGVGATNHGIANSYEVPFHVGLNDVRNVAGSRFIDYSTAKKRTGFLKEYLGRGTTGTAQASSTADLVVTLPEPLLATTRAPLAEINFGSSGLSLAYTHQIFNNSDTTMTVRVFNSHSVAQTFDVFWRVAGD